MRPLVRLLNLNRMCYNDALNVQIETTKRVLKAIELNEPIPHTLILVEHNPIYTIGIRSHPYPIHVETQLKQLGAEFVRTNRGGLITFHGHGQLVAYPIIYLGSFNPSKSIKWYVQQLECTIIDVCDIFRVKSSVICGFPGVWVNGERKIAAIGIHTKKYVTMHGIAMNCNTDLSWYDHIVPCGIKDKKVTSFTNELNTNITIDDVIPHFIDSFNKNFNCNII